MWRDQFGSAPPYATGPDVLFVAYYASAELGCHRVLGWPMPARILDLVRRIPRPDQRPHRPPPAPACSARWPIFGLDAIGATEKQDMRRGRRRPLVGPTRAEILDYCESDVVALARLLPAMPPRIDLPRALLRGRYMAAAAAMEHNGTPIDVGDAGASCGSTGRASRTT